MIPTFISEKIKIFDENEIFIKNKKRLCYLISCNHCNNLHYKPKYEIIRGINRNCKFYCSLKCHGKGHKTKKEVTCLLCNKTFHKLISQIKSSPNSFCSKSCSATFNNKNKKYGTRRSKLEKIIEEMIVATYPKLKLECNKKHIIGSELDFYFPELFLAIQINGPLHYLPIYGEVKFNQIQKMDEEKRIKCNELHINLIEINCSKDNYLIKSLIAMRLSEIKSIIEEKIGFEPMEGY